MGVACAVPKSDLMPGAFINAADAAMYRAKSGGRARYEVAGPADWNIGRDTPRTVPAPLSQH
jgi:hypothetical protein